MSEERKRQITAFRDKAIAEGREDLVARADKALADLDIADVRRVSEFRNKAEAEGRQDLVERADKKISDIQAASPQPDEWWQKALSPLEIGAAAITDIPARAVSGIVGAGAAPFIGVNEAEKLRRQVYQGTAFPVTTQTGKAAVEGLGNIIGIKQAGEFIEGAKTGAKTSSDWVFEKTGSPELAAAVEAGGIALPEVMELLLLRSGAKAVGERGGITPQPVSIPEQQMTRPTPSDDLDLEPEATQSQIAPVVEAVAGKSPEAVVEQVQPEARIVEASQRQNFPLTPDQYSQNAAFIEVAQASKSADPDMRAKEIESISRLERELNKLKKDTGGYTDIAAANSALANRYNSMIKKIESRESPQYDRVKDRIANAEVPYLDTPRNLYSLIRNKISEVGFNNRGEPNLTGEWLNLYKKLEENRPLNDKGEPVGEPQMTYGLIEDLRRDIGSGYKKSGTFKDADSGQLDLFYGALAKDQMEAAKQYGVDADLELAHRMTQQRKALEDNVTNFDKIMDKDGNITDIAFMDKMQKSLSAAANGNMIPFTRMIDAVPYNMKEQIILSALDPLTSSKSIKTGETTGRMADISKALNKNKEAKAKLFKYLSPERRVILDDLFSISEGIYRSANRQNASRTARDVMRQMDKKFDELLKVYGMGAGGASMIDPLSGGALAAGGRQAEKILANKKSVINKASNMLSSDAFKQSMNAYLDGDKMLAQNKLIESPEYQSWVKSLSNKADKDKLMKLGFFAWWLGMSDEAQTPTQEGE